MRIAIIASIWIPVPPKSFGFGAQEYLSYYIAEGMQRKGHDVTLFASGDSNVTVKLVSVNTTQVSQMKFPDPRIKDMFELMNISECYKQAANFDLIHNQLLPYGLPFAPLTKTPTLHTLHHRIYEERADIFLYKRYKDQNYVSISRTQKNIIPELNYVSTVYNGVDTSTFSFQQKPQGDYIVYLGRMKRYKGIHTAIRVAKTLGVKLKIVSPMPSPTQSDYKEVIAYWENEIQPCLGDTIEYTDEIIGEEKVNLLQNAKLLLFPLEREEPFGMTVIEAMSSGTPVVTFALGSMPELVVDGKTGYLIKFDESNRNQYTFKKTYVEGMEEATKKIYALSEADYLAMRKSARAHVEKNFSIHLMVDRYEEIYKVISEKHKD